MKITPVILAGGVGTRLWPLSRKSYPKQFSKIFNDNSLFQECALRLISSDIITFKEHKILTSSEYRFIVKEQLKDINVKASSILIEPSSKNTAPAILSSCYHVLKTDPDAIIFVAPSDHLIKETNEIHKLIKKGLPAVEAGKIITFGISPNYPETGFGYLKKGTKSKTNTFRVSEFVEKPNKEKCKKMLQTNEYFWNSGMFLFKATDMINEFKKSAKQFIEPVEMAVVRGKMDLDFFRTDENEWSKCGNESIDYAIMEKSKNLEMVIVEGGWSDLGSWDTVSTVINNENIIPDNLENIHYFDCKDTMLRSENSNQHIVGVGLENILAIAMPDAVLVTQKDRAQDVRHVVDYLKEKKISQAEHFRKSHRPWGWFEIIAVQNDHFQVKKIMVHPKASLSLQKHKYRSEHWVVVTGNPTVTINDTQKTLSEGQSVYVPLGAMHRLENHTNSPILLIEIQTGSYLGEDDIERFDDLYARD